MIGLLAASLISPFFVDLTPEIRTTYQSLGKLVEDRPMQITHLRTGLDTGQIRDGVDFGRFGFYNWDVSSLTDRRSDVHRHALYHTEYGGFWDYTFDIADGWKLKNGVLCAWTIYRGFEKETGNGEFWWWEVSQSLVNPYLVPYYRMRRYVSGSDYFYFRAGVRRKFRFLDDFYATPEVYVDGGNDRNYRRVIGENSNGGDWGAGGVSSLTFRLELGWELNANFTVFAFVEQYEVTGDAARETNAKSSYECAHNDWTHGGVGVKIHF